MSEPSIQGTCLCGAVQYRITGKILGFQYCHCSRCRRFTGSAHAANLFTNPDQLTWSRGADSVGSYLLDAEPPFPTAFCKGCGSSLPSMSSTGKYWVVPAGTLDDDPGLRPTRNIFWDSRAPWYEHVSDLPQHAEWPED
ncbi:MAG: GFA family protein [Planctomycetota bacterium]|nr:GFA family protein [Planctomycetota bacterium]